MGRVYSTELSKLLQGVIEVPSALDTLIQGLAIDSRAVKSGDLFIALSGGQNPADYYVEEAVAKGAVAVLIEGETGSSSERLHESAQVLIARVSNLRAKVGLLADRFFQHPSSDLKVVGVTGTNGKTSVSHYCAQLLNLNGMRTGLIGTLGYGILEGGELKATMHTTPNAVDVHRFLAQMRDQGAKVVVMEVSSHGLSQGRVDEVQFEGAVFTNLSRDHLDYHGSMEAYGEAKATLFKTESLTFAVINAEDPFSARVRDVVASGLKADAVSMIGFGESEACELRASNVQYQDGIAADIQAGGETFALRSTLVGHFGLMNLLAAVGVAQGLGLNVSALKGLGAISAVPGRMNVFSMCSGAKVVVDYAHTPDALQNVLDTVKAHSPKRLMLVFGCGGDRDKGKRSLMAQVAENMANEVIVTDDNPRSEDPKEIVGDILSGFESMRNIRVEHDRRVAIESVLDDASEGDWVVIAGKGHEDYQEISGKRFHLSDIEIVKEYDGKQDASALSDGLPGVTDAS